MVSKSGNLSVHLDPEHWELLTKVTGRNKPYLDNSDAVRHAIENTFGVKQNGESNSY